MRFEDWYIKYTTPASKDVVTHFSTVYACYRGASQAEGQNPPELLTRTRFARAMVDVGWYLRSTTGGDLVYCGLVVEPMLFRPRSGEGGEEELEVCESGGSGSDGSSSTTGSESC